MSGVATLVTRFPEKDPSVIQIFRDLGWGEFGSSEDQKTIVNTLMNDMSVRKLPADVLSVFMGHGFLLASTVALSETKCLWTLLKDF